jgi:formylglycine-generating enzyme required for sulfatase activity
MKYLLILLTLLSMTASASRGITIDYKASEASNAVVAGSMQLYTNSYALIIGIDDYSNGWPRLSNGVSDARKVAAALEGKGFDVTLKANLDGDQLEDAFEDFFIDKGDDPESRLFVWYAGHGHTVDGEGYLIPTDGVMEADSRNFRRKSLSLRRFSDYVRLAQSKHVYTVFDSCFAGTIFNVARSAPPPAITRVTSEPVRQFLSSGDAGQTVSDDGTFANLFVEALNGERRADLNRDGYLTAEEMGSFLTTSISNYTQNKQIPRHGKLSDPKFDKGDFVFLASLTTPTSIAEAVAATSPAESSFSMADIIRQVNAQKQASQDWANKLQDMKNAQQQVKALDADRAVETSLRISAWQRFQQAFTEDNPYSMDDNTMLSEASQRIQALQQAARREQQQATQLASLASTSGGALSSSGKACDVCPEMVLIPAGSFRMGDLGGGGDGDEKPVHRADIKAFALGKTEVTFFEYDAFARATNTALPADKKGWGRGSRPVINVSWDDAKAYISWLSKKAGQSYRLPTEAEWEYAARAGTTTKYPWGDDVGRNNANCDGCGSQWDDKSTAPAGSFSANAFGLHDMHGNVHEWIEDCYKDSYSGASSTGVAHQNSACSLRVLRGGSWGYGASYLRSAYRYWYHPSWRSHNFGFRVAQDLK